MMNAECRMQNEFKSAYRCPPLILHSSFGILHSETNSRLSRQKSQRK
jgi:hypothetical protein